MKQNLTAAILALAVCSAGGAFAAEQSAMLRVENMYCASCPYIIQQTLARVPGVTSVKIAYEKAAAVAVAIVEYDDSKADVTALTEATSNVGFPSRVVQ